MHCTLISAEPEGYCWCIGQEQARVGAQSGAEQARGQPAAGIHPAEAVRAGAPAPMQSMDCMGNHSAMVLVQRACFWGRVVFGPYVWEHAAIFYVQTALHFCN